MAISRDIAATYRGPAAVVRRLLALGPREDRALAFVMGACALMFVARLPALSRQAHLEGTELNPLMGGALLGVVFILPLFLYVIAAVVHLVLGALTRRGSGFGARLSLFWALLAAVPLALLHGLTAGFVGPGPALVAVGVIWASVFLWFWGSGLAVVYGQTS